MSDPAPPDPAPPAPKDPALVQFDELIAQGAAIPDLLVFMDRVAVFQWKTACRLFLNQFQIPHGEGEGFGEFMAPTAMPALARHRDQLVGRLRALRAFYMQGGLPPKPKTPSAAPPLGDLDHLVRIFDRFHAVALQLQKRRHEQGAPRPTLMIKDEYDVQDLTHALLKLHFNDVRPEDHGSWTGGSSSRQDFVLGQRGIVIELKHTRDGLRDKEVGEQVAHDVQLYSVHPECKTLVFFVYDPGLLLKNPKGLEATLSDRVTRGTKAMDVVVIVRPQP